METLLVRFIPTDHHPEYGWSGSKPSLCFKESARKARCVVIRESEIGTVDLPLDLVEKCTIVSDPQGSDIPYSPERFVKKVMEIGKPLTPEARTLLQSVNGKKVPLPPNPPPKASTVARTANATPLKTAGAELIITLAAEVKLPPPKLRRFLRSQGLKAPYTDESAIRKALKKLTKTKPGRAK